MTQGQREALGAAFDARAKFDGKPLPPLATFTVTMTFVASAEQFAEVKRSIFEETKFGKCICIAMEEAGEPLPAISATPEARSGHDDGPDWPPDVVALADESELHDK